MDFSFVQKVASRHGMSTEAAAVKGIRVREGAERFLSFYLRHLGSSERALPRLVAVLGGGAARNQAAERMWRNALVSRWGELPVEYSEAIEALGGEGVYRLQRRQLSPEGAAQAHAELVYEKLRGGSPDYDEADIPPAAPRGEWVRGFRVYYPRNAGVDKEFIAHLGLMQIGKGEYASEWMRGRVIKQSDNEHEPITAWVINFRAVDSTKMGNDAFLKSVSGELGESGDLLLLVPSGGTAQGIPDAGAVLVAVLDDIPDAGMLLRGALDDWAREVFVFLEHPVLVLPTEFFSRFAQGSKKMH